MNRQEKRDMVSFLQENFSQAPAAFLLGVKGLTVREMQNVRHNVRQEGGTVKVAKNTLLTIASEDDDAARQMQPYFQGQVAIVFAHNEPVQTAQAIKRVQKEVSSLEVKAGIIESQFADANKFEFFASLPSREHVLAQFCAALKAPITSHATVLKQVTSKFARVLQQVKEQKENQ